MKSQERSISYALFSRLTLGWVAWLWLGLILALGGVFYPTILFLGLVLIVASCVWHCRTLSITATTFAKGALWFLLPFVLCSIFLSSFEPTVFSGRDQGSYSLAAIRLADNHTLTFSTPASAAFFDIYGPGRALNFPGFAYTQSGELITQFPLGYITWLAPFFAFFGLNGFAIANAFTLVIFLFSFALLLKLFVPTPFRRWGMTLAITGFPLLWFAKFTLSENLAWALFVSLSLQLVLFFKGEEKLLSGLTALALASFFAFTRIEGFAFLAITIGILLATKDARSLWKKHIRSHILSAVSLGILFIGTLIADIVTNLPFYKTIGKVVVEKIQSIGSATPSLLTDHPFTSFLSLNHILWSYGLLPIFIAGMVGVLVLFKRRDFAVLIPFFLALPTCIYLIQPNISFDHPWMLRRFAFSLWPALLFSTIVGVAYIDAFFARRYASIAFFRQGWYSSLLLAILFINQLPAFLSFLPFSENQGLLKQTQSLSESFTFEDLALSKVNNLVLISRNASGNSWAMLPDTMNALFGTDAVYFFNPEDLARLDSARQAKLDTSRFQNTYLIVSKDELSHYQSIQDRLTPVRPYTILQTDGFIFQVQ